MPVQLTMAFGVDGAVNESSMEKEFGPAPVEYRRDTPIDPDDFESIPEFQAHVVKRFNEFYFETLKLLSPELQRGTKE